MSILYPYMMTDLNLNYTQLGIVTGVSSTISGFLQMMWSLLNRYVSKRVLLGVGNLLISLGCLITGAVNRFVELVGAMAVSGTGQAAQHPVGTSILAQKFRRERTSGALSIHYGLGYVGNMISPVLLSSIAIFFGWRLAIYVLGIIPLMAGLSVLYYLRGEESVKSVDSGMRSNLWKDVSSVIRMRSAILIVAVQAFASSGTGMDIITTYIPLFLKNQLNVGIFETSIIYSAAVVGGVIGTIVFGHLANRFGSLEMASAILASGSIAIFLLTLHNSFGLLLLPHIFIIGITSFSFSSLLQAHLASIATPQQRDILLGFFFTIGFGISALWTTYTGFLIDTYGSFTPAWILKAGLGAVAFLFAAAALRTR
jgi:MFS family permease